MNRGLRREVSIEPVETLNRGTNQLHSGIQRVTTLTGVEHANGTRRERRAPGQPRYAHSTATVVATHRTTVIIIGMSFIRISSGLPPAFLAWIR